MTEKSTATQMTQDPNFVSLVEPQTLLERINKIHDDIERRAFEIFESGDWSGGHDLEHWFKAEAELLHPIHVTITETDEAVNVAAEVPGFNAKELQVSLEPGRLTISGKRETSKAERKKGKTVYEEKCSSELLRIVDLPADVDATKTTATLKNGILTLNMTKAGQAKTAQVDVKT